jgi:hypothetical protein
MYSRQEATEIRKRFWTSFGKYLSPIPPAGDKVNWINYKTGIRFIYFRMEVENEAYIAVEITHKDAVTRQKYFDLFVSLKKVFEAIAGKDWRWQAEAKRDDSRSIACISSIVAGVNIYDPEDWPAIISFLKQRILALDKFWHTYKSMFEMMEP